MSLAHEARPTPDIAVDDPGPSPVTPAAASPIPVAPAWPRPHRFSVAAYEEMTARGILSEQDRVELIRGEIREKMTIGDRHAACVKRLNRMLSRLVGDQAIVSVQDPIQLDDSVPEPDIALLRARDDFYATAKPAAADVLLVIEVADTSLGFDREVKADLYARAGIAEYWIVNLIDRALERHTRPDPARGVYALREVLDGEVRVESAAVPGLGLTVAEALGA